MASSTKNQRGGRRSGSSSAGVPQDYPEAFSPGTDFQKTGDVNHAAYYASAQLTRHWQAYAAQFGAQPTSAEEAVLMKDWDPRTNEVYGYCRTANSFEINKALYDPANAGKPMDQIFTAARDRSLGRRRGRDLQTVQTLDQNISTHTTPADASYTRFCSPSTIQATFKLSDADMAALQSAGTLSSRSLRQLSRSMSGGKGFSAAYTSTSGNRSANAFGDPSAKQSNGYIFERKISVPKGTNAFCARKNAQESEVIFGRGMQTRITGISIAGDGHIVIHEMFDGYR